MSAVWAPQILYGSYSLKVIGEKLQVEIIGDNNTSGIRFGITRLRSLFV